MISRKSEQEGERIAKRIARAGLCSRREAEQWIFAGRVEVNGNPIASPALNVSAADRIKVDGKPRPEREQGSNLWLTFAMREGKNREIRNVLGALGLQVNRLIRISFGPFRLGELSEGAVEEVATRVLREQIGERVAQEAGADFAAPVLQRAPDTSPLEGESLPRTRPGVDRPEAGREGGSIRESSSEKIRRGVLTDRKGRR